MTLTRSKLEEYIGENVEVTLFDGDVIRGYLGKTGTEDDNDKTKWICTLLWGLP